MDEEFAKRVREEISEGANPLYIEGVLRGNIQDLFWWVDRNLKDHSKTVFEAKFHSEQGDRGNTLFGIRILENNFRMVLFILKEMKKKVETDDARSVEARVIEEK